MRIKMSQIERNAETKACGKNYRLVNSVDGIHEACLLLSLPFIDSFSKTSGPNTAPYC